MGRTNLHGSPGIRFAVLAFGRSGSTLLVDYLCCHPHVICYHEPFHRRGWHPRLAKIGTVPGAVEFLYEKGLDPTIGLRVRKLLRRPVRAVGRQRAHRGRFAAVGFKATVDQALMVFPDLWAWMKSDPGTRIVLVERESVLARFVSYRVARSRGIWHSETPKDEVSTRMRVDPDEFHRFFAEEKQHRETILDALNDRPDRVHRLTHEQLQRSPRETMAGVFAFLGVEPCEKLEGRTVKLVQGEMRDIVENYDEVVRRVPEAEEK